MNSFNLFTEEAFMVGESNLEFFLNRPKRLEGGLIFICKQGEATISTDIINYEIKRNSKVTLLPGTIFTVHRISKNFTGSFIAFSHILFDEANFRLDPPFFGFLKENPVYHMPEEKVGLFLGLFPFLKSVYDDPENQFRYHIVRNQLQCIFWETYDKTHRIFKNIQILSKSSLQQEEIFKRFMRLVRTHCKQQHDVAFYADQLCITPRYLSFITRKITKDKTPKDMINIFLTLEIKVLLESTQLSIQEIAHRLNFPDQSYLGRYFKRYAGKSPSEYRSLVNN